MNDLNKIDIFVYISLILLLSLVAFIGNIFISSILIIYIGIYIHKKEKKEKDACK